MRWVLEGGCAQVNGERIRRKSNLKVTAFQEAPSFNTANKGWRVAVSRLTITVYFKRLSGKLFADPSQH